MIRSASLRHQTLQKTKKVTHSDRATPANGRIIILDVLLNNCPELLEILSLESLLTYAISVPQLHCLQSVVKSAERVMGVSLPSDQDILLSRCTQNIVKDSSHPEQLRSAPTITAA